MKEQFKNNFGLPKEGFLEPIDLKDTEIGFSVYKTRAEEGFKSLFRVFIKNEDLSNVSKVKPVIVTASYGKESEDGIIVSSSEFKRKVSGPVDFISEGEFFYDTENNQLFFKEKKISGIDLLKEVDRWHLKPTRPIFGLGLRARLIWYHYILAWLFRLLFKFFAWIQYLFSGEKIKIFDNLKDLDSFVRSKTDTSLHTKEGELIDLFGYKIKPWIAVLYSTVHLAAYLLLYKYKYKPEWLLGIFKNNFLTLMYGIISLGFANTILSTILKWINLKSLLKFIQSLFWSAATKKIPIYYDLLDD